MNWYSALYWFTRLDGINQFIGAVSIGSAALILITLLSNFLNGNDWKDTPRNFLKWISFISLFFWLLFIFTPSKKDAAIIVCGGAIGTYLQKDTTIRQIPKEVMEYIRVELKSSISKAKDEVSTDAVKQELKEQILQKIRNSDTKEALDMLKDSTVQNLLKE